nr:CU044_5270 family protein [Kribbella sandramycini]
MVEQSRPDDYTQPPDADRRDRDLARAFAVPAGTGARRRRSVRPVAFVVAGLATCSVAAAIAIPLLNNPGSSNLEATPTTPTASPRAAAVRSVLFEAAAAAAGTTAPNSARYWHHSSLDISVEREAAGPALIEQRRTVDLWLPRDDAGASWSISQFQGARALTGGGDRWRVAVGAPCPKPGAAKPCWTTKEVTSRAGAPDKQRIETVAKPFAIGSTNLSVAELGRLPDNPAELKTKLLALSQPSPGDPNATLFETTSALINRLPTTPAVRAAAFQLLAGIPGVQLLPKTSDALGRPGTAVALTTDHGPAGAHETRLIFDPQSGKPLAYEARIVRPGTAWPGLPPGTRYLAELTKTTGWTTATP